MPILGFRRMAAILAASLFAVSLAIADPRKINTDENRVAIGGYDTVAYFTLAKPAKGEPRFEVVWAEARWRFASAEHRDMFLRDPDRYAPRFGGFCAVGLSRGHLATVNPEAWQIVDGKLFLTFSKKSLEELQQDIAGTVAKAEQNWPLFGQR